MALFAHDMFDTESGARPPISMHPAFPAIVALWFAALLGIGSLILPNLLVERLVGATGIGALVPGANPPFGWTAHGLIAVFAAASSRAGSSARTRRARRGTTRNSPLPGRARSACATKSTATASSTGAGCR